MHVKLKLLSLLIISFWRMQFMLHWLMSRFYHKVGRFKIKQQWNNWIWKIRIVEQYMEWDWGKENWKDSPFVYMVDWLIQAGLGEYNKLEYIESHSVFVCQTDRIGYRVLYLPLLLWLVVDLVDELKKGLFKCTVTWRADLKTVFSTL